MPDNQQNHSAEIHTIRNQLNQISMHAEVAKMLLEQNAQSEKILQSIDVILQSCEDCDTTLSTFNSSDTHNG